MPRYYTTFEAAHILGVSLPTVVNWIKAQRLEAHRTPGGHRRIAREQLAAFMAQHGMPVPPELLDAVDGRRRALVVGEPGAALDHVAEELAAAGVSVQRARAGFAAGLAAARSAPDVVVLVDPPPNGGDTLAGLREDEGLATLPVVAAARPEHAVGLRAAGCTLVLVSPIAAGALADAASRALVLAGATAPARRRS